MSSEEEISALTVRSIILQSRMLEPKREWAMVIAPVHE